MTDYDFGLDGLFRFIIIVAILAIIVVAVITGYVCYKWGNSNGYEAAKNEVASRGKVVPKNDYDLLKYTNWQLAKGQTVHIFGDKTDQSIHNIAKTLYTHYEVDEMEILTELGVWVNSEKAGTSNDKT